MAWKTGTAAGYIALLQALRDYAAARAVESGAIHAAGSGYSVNDTLTVSGGTATTAATFNVDSIGGSGEVTAVSLVEEGEYTVEPSDPVATTVSPAGGSGCTLDLEWFAKRGWLTDRDTTYSGSDRELIMHGEGDGSQAIYCGARTFQSGSNRAWELAGFTGYDSGSSWSTQPGISPGRYDGAGTSGEGAYMPLSTGTITYWFFVSTRRIFVVAKIGTTYVPGYIGFLDQFGTTTEFPYPMAVFGACSDVATVYSYSGAGFSGAVDPIGGVSDTYGPAFVRDPAGVWQTVRNGYASSSSGRNASQDLVVYPAGLPNWTTADAEDRGWIQSTTPLFVTTKIIPNSGHPGTTAAYVQQTPNSAHDLTIPFPATIIEANAPTFRVYGELAGLFWVDSSLTSGNMVAEDTISIGSDTYLVLQNCNRTDRFAFYCIKEA